MKLLTIAAVFLLTTSAAWATFLQRAEHPQHQAAPLQACDGTLPTSIVGRWRYDAVRTQAAMAQANGELGIAPATITPAPEPQPAVDAVPGLTITNSALVSEMPNLFRIETSYRIVGGSANRYLIELFDEQGAGETLTLTLIPCGLTTTAIPHCNTKLCERKRDEVLQQLADKSGMSLEDMKQASQTTPTSTPLVIYYRWVGGDTTSTGQ